MALRTTDGMADDEAATTRQPKLPAPISAWEIGGVPAALVFYAAYRVGWLSALGIAEHMLVDFMTICFCGVATLRALGPRVPGWIRGTVRFFRSLRKE